MERLRRSARVAAAFFFMGFRLAVAYPMNFAMSQIQPLLQVIVFYFVAQLVDRNGPAVGGDYFTYIVIGWIGVQVLNAGLRTFSAEVQTAINQGRFEMLLIEPVRWRLLPFGLVQWPIVQKVAAALIIVVVALPLGAQFVWAGLPIAIITLALGLLATLGVGILSASVVVLAKRSDPIVTLYALAATVLSGALFPIELLPTPLQWLSWTIPHTYVNSSLRHSLMPAGDTLPGPEPAVAALALVVFCVVVYPVALWMFGRALETGRRLGILSAY